MRLFLSVIFAAEPWLPWDPSECEAQQSAPCCGEAPLTQDVLYPATKEVLSSSGPKGNHVKWTMKGKQEVLDLCGDQQVVYDDESMFNILNR